MDAVTTGCAKPGCGDAAPVKAGGATAGADSPTAPPTSGTSYDPKPTTGGGAGDLGSVLAALQASVQGLLTAVKGISGGGPGGKFDPTQMAVGHLGGGLASTTFQDVDKEQVNIALDPNPGHEIENLERLIAGRSTRVERLEKALAHDAQVNGQLNGVDMQRLTVEKQTLAQITAMVGGIKPLSARITQDAATLRAQFPELGGAPSPAQQMSIGGGGGGAATATSAVPSAPGNATQLLGSSPGVTIAPRALPGASANAADGFSTRIWSTVFQDIDKERISFPIGTTPASTVPDLARIAAASKVRSERMTTAIVVDANKNGQLNGVDVARLVSQWQLADQTSGLALKLAPLAASITAADRTALLALVAEGNAAGLLDAAKVGRLVSTIALRAGGATPAQLQVVGSGFDVLGIMEQRIADAARTIAIRSNQNGGLDAASAAQLEQMTAQLRQANAAMKRSVDSFQANPAGAISRIQAATAVYQSGGAAAFIAALS